MTYLYISVVELIININTVFFSQKQFLLKELPNFLHPTVLAVKMSWMQMKVQFAVKLIVLVSCAFAVLNYLIPQTEASLQ